MEHHDGMDNKGDMPTMNGAGPATVSPDTPVVK
jgi:hypothetical protein